LDWNAVYLENHDQSRIVSHFGAARSAILPKEKDYVKLWQRSAKMLALFQLTLRGTSFLYQGQEIGMTNFDFKSLNELNDVESHGLNKLMKKLCIPAFLRWRWIKISSRDNARTPVQWDNSENAGFTKGKPWLGINSNYKYINYASQKNDSSSVLNFYKKLINLRKNNKCLVYGDFLPIYADDRIMIYQRKLITDGQEAETYTIALNFSSKTVKLPQKYAALLLENQIVCVSDGEPDIKKTGYLLPWDGVLV